MTDVGTTPRKAMSPTRRLRLWEKHAGRCVICKEPIDGTRDRWIIEHIIALALGGEDKDDNCGPAHNACALDKTRDDVAKISKAKRAKERHLGIKRKTQPIQSRGFDHKPKREQLPLPTRKRSFYQSKEETV